jgi:hypothetical protein
MWSGLPYTTSRFVELIGFAQERYPEQFEQFEAANPELPEDLKQLTAVPDADGSASGRKEPVWLSLLGAVTVYALLALVVVKAIVPFAKHKMAPPATIAQSSTVNRAPLPQPGNPAAAGKPFSSGEGRFSAQFPAAPAQSSEPVPLAGGGTMTLYRFRSDDDNLSYIVTYNDYPVGYNTGDAPAILANARNGLVESTKGDIVSDAEISLNGVPGRAFKFTGKDGVSYSVHDFLNGRRLYQAVVIASPGATGSQAEDFLNSFRIY